MVNNKVSDDLRALERKDLATIRAFLALDEPIAQDVSTNNENETQLKPNHQ